MSRPDRPRAEDGYGQTLAELRSAAQAQERRLVESALAHCEWRALRAAQLLGVRQDEIRRLIDRLGLREEYDRRNPGRGRRKMEAPGHRPDIEHLWSEAKKKADGR